MVEAFNDRVRLEGILVRYVVYELVEALILSAISSFVQEAR